MSEFPRKPEAFTFNGVPNQRVIDVFHALDGKFKANWLRRALRAGCCTTADIEAFRKNVKTAHLEKMWAARDAYWAQFRARKEAKTAKAGR